VTGEPISARDLYRSVIEFRSIALNVFATNTLPTFSGGIDRGVSRRILLVLLNRVIPLEERVEHIGLRIAKEEADILLAWAVGGAQSLIRQRDFTVPPSSEKGLRRWLYTADPVLAWTLARVRPLADHLSADDRTTWKKSGDAHSLFTAWALDNGFRKDMLPAVNGFVQRLEAHVPAARVKHTKTGNWIAGVTINVTEDFPDDGAGDDEC
jgi:phage/plasmid-associated DNA primase